MAMLDRYKKNGGFNQLLTLLETCGVQKQQKFLEIVRQEDPRWADALVAKMIDLNRVMSWNETAIGEVTNAMLEINVAAVLKTLPQEKSSRVLGTLAHIKRRKVEELMETTNPSAGETATSINKLFETVRRLMAEGILRMDKIDPIMFVDSDIEDRLAQCKDIVGVPSFADSMAAHAMRPPSEETPHTGTFSTLTGTHKSSDHHDHSPLKVVTSLDQQAWSENDVKDIKAAQQELTVLRRKVLDLQKENGLLKQEVAQLKSRMEQIRKLA